MLHGPGLFSSSTSAALSTRATGSPGNGCLHCMAVGVVMVRDALRSSGNADRVKASPAFRGYAAPAPSDHHRLPPPVELIVIGVPSSMKALAGEKRGTVPVVREGAGSGLGPTALAHAAQISAAAPRPAKAPSRVAPRPMVQAFSLGRAQRTNAMYGIAATSMINEAPLPQPR